MSPLVDAPAIFVAILLCVSSYYHTTGEKCYLRWWTRLPASGEFKSRLKTQKAMANRLTQLPSLEKTLAKHGRSQSAIPFGTGLDRYNKVNKTCTHTHTNTHTHTSERETERERERERDKERERERSKPDSDCYIYA